MFRITPKSGATQLPHPTLPLPARLPAEGAVLARVTPFWRRREREGGVTIVEEKPATPAES